MMKPLPSAGELEIALHRLLSKDRFTGAGHIAVSADAAGGQYLVSLSPDAAELLCTMLAVIRPDCRPEEPTRWALSTSQAVAVIMAAEPRPVYWPLSRA